MKPKSQANAALPPQPSASVITAGKRERDAATPPSRHHAHAYTYTYRQTDRGQRRRCSYGGKRRRRRRRPPASLPILPFPLSSVPLCGRRHQFEASGRKKRRWREPGREQRDSVTLPQPPPLSFFPSLARAAPPNPNPGLPFSRGEGKRGACRAGRRRRRRPSLSRPRPTCYHCYQPYQH